MKQLRRTKAAKRVRTSEGNVEMMSQKCNVTCNFDKWRHWQQRGTVLKKEKDGDEYINAPHSVQLKIKILPSEYAE